jgi:Zn-dependent protease
MERSNYFRIKRLRLFGVPIVLHWSVFLVVGICFLMAFEAPISALSAVLSYFGLILLHECGHAIVARHYGCRIHEIRLSIIHGVCVHTAPYEEFDDAVIAWGGVIAQLIVAIPILFLALVPNTDKVPGLDPVIAILGYYSAIVAIFNLTPAHPLDGHKAWRILPLLWKRYRRRSAPKPKAKKLRVVK